MREPVVDLRIRVQRVLVMRDDALEGILSASDIFGAVADGKL